MTFRPKCVKLNSVAKHFICALKGKENMNMWNMNSFKIWSSFMKSGGWYVMPGTVLMSKFMQISSSSIFLKADIRLQTIYRSLKRWRNTHWHCSDISLPFHVDIICSSHAWHSNAMNRGRDRGREEEKEKTTAHEIHTQTQIPFISRMGELSKANQIITKCLKCNATRTWRSVS